MERILKVGTFRDDDAGYIAVAAAAPGLWGLGSTPDHAAHDLLFRFLAPFDAMPTSPASDAEFVSVIDVEIQIASFEPN